jgi:hypothetical protein
MNAAIPITPMMSRTGIPTIEASAIPQHDTATKRRKYLMPAMLSEINLRHYWKFWRFFAGLGAEKSFSATKHSLRG